MQNLARNGYSADAVETALHSSPRLIKFKYNLFDSQNKLKSVLDCILDGTISNNALAQIKRTAQFKILDKGDINFLSDRIQPVAMLKTLSTFMEVNATLPTFTRNSIAYQLNGMSINSNIPRYEAGQFGQGIMIEEGTINLLTANQSNFETDLTGWTATGFTITRDTSLKWEGSACLKAVITTAGDYFMETPQITVSSSTVYTFSAYLNIPAIASGALRVIELTSAGVYVKEHSTSAKTSTTGWERITDTFTSSATTGKFLLRLQVSSVGTTYWDGIQLEQKSFATSWVLGGVTRVAETLTIPTAGVLIPAQGTLEFVYIPNLPSTVSADFNLFTWGLPGTRGFMLRHVGSISIPLHAEIYSPSTTDINYLTPYLAGDKLRIGFSWTASQCKFYVNGSLIGTANVGFVTPTEIIAQIGSRESSLYPQANGIIDNLCISSIARTDADMLTRGTSASPLTVDRYTTYKMKFDGNLNTTMGQFTPDGFAEFPLGVFLLTTPPREIDPNTGNIIRNVQAYDLLQILVDDKVTDRYTVVAGINYIEAVRTILTGDGFTTVNLTPVSLTLPITRDWEPGTTKLQIINDLLSSINYRSLIMDENGTPVAMPYVSPSNRASEYIYVNNSESVMNLGITEELDLFAVPNKFIAMVSQPDRPYLISTYTNSNPLSQTSTVSRGRTIVSNIETIDMVDQTTLDAYVAKKAFEASQIYQKIIFSTVIMPHHSDFDVFTLTHSGLGISDKYTEIEWSIPLKAGASMTHSIRKVVSV